MGPSESGPLSRTGAGERTEIGGIPNVMNHE
jgi:hypothetical protein